MSTLGDRIKEIRELEKMTQQEFADRLGTPRSNIGGYEKGARNPSDAVVTSICREFNVNESWLRTGEGQIFKPVTRDEEIAAFMGDVLRGETPDFRRRFISVLARLDVSEWELLEKMALKLAEECKKDGQA